MASSSNEKEVVKETSKAVKAVPYAWCCGVDTKESMIGCDASILTIHASGCTEWYHLSCVGLAHLKEHQIQNMEWKCELCLRYLAQSILLSESKYDDTYESEEEDTSSSNNNSIFDGLTAEEVTQITQTMKTMQ
eukprot:782411_1